MREKYDCEESYYESDDDEYSNDGEQDVRTCTRCQVFKAHKYSEAYIKHGLCCDCYAEDSEEIE